MKNCLSLSIFLTHFWHYLLCSLSKQSKTIGVGYINVLHAPVIKSNGIVPCISNRHPTILLIWKYWKITLPTSLVQCHLLHLVYVFKLKIFHYNYHFWHVQLLYKFGEIKMLSGITRSNISYKEYLKQRHLI